MAQSIGSERARYGIDAPGIMFGLLLGGGAVVAVGWLVGASAAGGWRFAGVVLIILGSVPAFFGTLMAVYAVIGKVRTRDYILNLARLGGDEAVLDVGTGAGLLLVGAAKRVPRGTVVGIDLWAAKDLSNNAVATTLHNVTVEGVADRVEIVTGDAREMPFPGERFDRLVSLLCLHNIEPPEDRARACREIARVLKPGGRIVIGDYVPTHSYATALTDAGLVLIQSKAAFGVALSLMWILIAEKPASG